MDIASKLTHLVVVIPAYQPVQALVQVVEELKKAGFEKIVVVDDGSSPQHRALFEKVQIGGETIVLRHAVNLGKGAALKTAFNYVLNTFPNVTAVVTADADGQHKAQDVLKVALESESHPESLCMGVREFVGAVPLRSMLGNKLTRWVFYFFAGYMLKDTQSGLRAIPRMFLGPLLKISTTGYDFELEMLVQAKSFAISVRQVDIETIYEEGNPTSHFNPIRDSLKIYYVFFRFALSSILTTSVDLLGFTLGFKVLGSILPSIVLGRSAALVFNFLVGKYVVFKSAGNSRAEALKFVVLVVAHLALSYQLISRLVALNYLGVFPAKVLVETILFLFSFSIQRIFIFTSESRLVPADSR